MNVIRHDHVTPDEPRWPSSPCCAEQLVSVVVSENRFSLMRADGHEDNNRRIVALDWREMRRMFPPDLVHRSQFYWRDDLRVVPKYPINSKDGTEPVPPRLLGAGRLLSR